MLRKSTISIISLFVIALVYLLYGIDRSDTTELLMVYGALFALYFLSVKFLDHWTSKGVIALAVFLRCISLFSTPNLSDDYYRFIWDGRMNNSGGDVYVATPNDAIESAEFRTDDLFDRLNSKGYFTVYPPVNQMVFAVSAFVGGDQLSVSLFILHLFMLIGEIAALFLLSRYLSQINLGVRGLILYALNPLVIVELCGNLHFEGLMITFLLAALALLKEKKFFWSAVFFALAILTKLLPLILLPALIPLLKKKSLLYFGSISLMCVVFSLPVLSTDLILSMGSSLDLYFRLFEFNASVYYMVREIGGLFLGYHPPIALLGPFLSIVCLLIILSISWLTKWGFAKKAFWIFMSYLLLTTTVHPWYVITPLLFAILSRTPVGVVWSCLVILSYSHYSNGGFSENYLLIFVEYAVVFAFAMFSQKLEWSLLQPQKLNP